MLESIVCLKKEIVSSSFVVGKLLVPFSEYLMP